MLNTFSITFWSFFGVLLFKTTSAGYGSVSHSSGGGYYQEGGQQVQPNEWIFDTGDSHTNTKEFKSQYDLSYGTGDSHTNTKEFKSLYDLSYGPEHYYTDEKQCTQRPKQPMNASLKCTSSTNSCKATCLTDYVFPNGDTSLYITCENGVWDEVPSCEPVCMPPCQNNGICLQPGECACPENFVGAYCEQEKKLCLSPPSLPRNSKRSCNSKTCTITCATGYRFPDGSSVTNMVCSEGRWTPTRKELTVIPDCQAVCTPPCQNAGHCLSHNVCQCPPNFRGPSCQYSVEVCSPKRLLFNGAYNCSGDNDHIACILTCPAGVEFEFPPQSKYICTYEKGHFEPSTVPKCKFTEDMEIIDLGGSSKTFYSAQNQSMMSGHSSRKKKVKQIVRHEAEQEEEDEGESYEKIITKTEIKIKKARKSKGKGKGKTYYEEEEEEESEDDYEDMEIPGIYSLYLSSDVNFKIRTPKPAICMTWNGNKVKTFDGLMYDSNLYCSHTLVQDYVDGSFSVILRSCPFDAEPLCSNALEIFLQDLKYTFDNDDGNVRLFTTKKQLPIPSQLPGMRVTLIGHKLNIILESIGVTVHWDGQKMVSIEATAGLFNRTAGLCGTMDQNGENDFMSKDGTLHTAPATFVDSWRAPSVDIDPAKCVMSGNIMNLECPEDILQQAITTCKQLVNSPKFSHCLKECDRESLLKTCTSDYCYCSDKKHPSVCACDGITVLAKDCQFRGVALEHGWRDMEICPITCQGGRIYQACGPSFEPYCGSTNESTQDTCHEGCFCQPGMIQNEGECIHIESCPCQLRGKTFKAGSKISKDCNTCTCDKGTWVCSDLTCGGRCSTIGDPHYLTFDGKRYDFMGKCSYYLVKSDNFSIEAENVACPGSISEDLFFGPSGVDLPSCTKSVTINIINGDKIKSVKLKQGRQILVDGMEIETLPIKLLEGVLKVKQASSTMILVSFYDGLKVWWDGVTRVYIDAPAGYRGKTKGLCGTFSSNIQDDFLTPEGDIESSVIAFANKWRTKETCQYVSDGLVPHPCQLNMENKELAITTCNLLKEKVFSECHWYVDVEPFYEDCLYDVCACKGDVSHCVCPVFAAYANECSRQGVVINWRHSVNQCAVQCPAGQVFEECGDECYRTCTDIQLDDVCTSSCVEGCRCPPGSSLNDQNECIQTKMCPCMYKGMTFNPGYKEVRPGAKYLELCACNGGKWLCDEANHDDENKYPPAADMRDRCLSSKHEEFTTCEPVEPMTCKNMLSYFPSTTAECRPGCVCKRGYVLDAVLKQCVLPKDCSCHHGSRSYNDGESILNACNKCICKAGNWDCTTKECPATCTTWGDSHFETFDGKDFDFQGVCSYVLSKGMLNGGEGFTVTIQNVLCGSLGVTCSKSVSVSITGPHMETITLTSDEDLNMPAIAKLDKLSVHRAGIFIVVEAPGLGLQVKWDRGTRVYVKLNLRWKGNVQGLCGNFNDDAQDDLKTPSSGIETSAVIFGDSWKLQDFCAKPTEQIDTCEEHPHRKTWAQRQCGILKSDVFKMCHSEVPVDMYMKRCIYDSCACDQGGDCECMCTALSAYAHACSMKGISIRWRTPDLCPMQCDPHCSEYNQCIPSCPVETCDNVLDQGKDQRMCNDDTCVEGCKIKPCGEGEIYLNNTFTECVPKSVCKHVCLERDGITYYEGDLIDGDECSTCHCSRGKIVCIGSACETHSFVDYTAPPHRDTEDICKSGWSPWINQDKSDSGALKTKSKNKGMKLGDKEPIPSLMVLKNLPGPGSCGREFIKSIECRTVNSHLDIKSTGEDVECDLEKGLRCFGSCTDYEIRVFCDCGDEIEILTLATPTKTQSTSGKIKQHPTTIVVPIPSKPLANTKCDPTIPHIEYPGDCFKFLHCSPMANGNWEYVEKTCGPTMMFNPVAMVCDWIYSVVAMKPWCGEAEVNVEPTDRPTTVKVPIPSKTLANTKCDPAIPHIEYPGDCFKFLHCSPMANGNWEYVEKTCGPTMMFNPVAMVCDWIYSVVAMKPWCGEAEVNVEPTDRPTTVKVPIPSKTLVNTKCDPAIPHIEYPGDCFKFLHCSPMANGNWEYVEKTCGPTMMFNPVAMVCDWIYSVVAMKPWCGEAEPSKCPQGEVWSDCAVPCGKACHYFSKDLVRKGLCSHGANVCEEGCVDSSRALSCPPRHLWRDNKICVGLADCPCMSNDGSLVMPGATYKESDCEVCQCIDSSYICDASFCDKHTNNMGHIEDFDVKTTKYPTKPTPVPMIIPSTATPPLICSEEKLITMVEGDNPLADSAFGSSSYLGSSFKPQYSRLNSKPTSESSGSWSPEINDQMQYLQIGFTKPEPLFGVIIRGSPIFDQYVTSFKILHSFDGVAFHYLVDDTTHPQIFSGCIDSKTPVKSMFKIPIEAKTIRIYPLTWHGSISIRVELLGCSRGEKPKTKTTTTTPTPHKYNVYETTPYVEHEIVPLCEDTMGVENGFMKPSQVKVSSTKSSKSALPALDLLKLSSSKGWTPNLNTPNEYVIFDFLQPTHLTGIKTKGGDYGWVSAFTVEYSTDGFIWNKIQDLTGEPKVFLGNVDSNSVKSNFFQYPVNSRYLKIVPIKWHETIELKAEPLGCFKFYPDELDEYIQFVTYPPEPTELICDVCPGVSYIPLPVAGTCRCYEPLAWNGHQCVPRTECPCLVGHIQYSTGAVYELDDCSRCVCTIGGVAQCKPKECSPCGKGLRPVKSATCVCLCEACPINEVLCQSSGACIPETSWCDGIQDCPDDEIMCSNAYIEQPNIVKQVEEKVTIIKTCPKPTCPPGFTIKKSPNKKSEPKLSAMFQSSQKTTKTTKTTSVGGVKKPAKNVYGSNLPTPQINDDKFTEECMEFVCIPERPIVDPVYPEIIRCPEPQCPNGYDIVMDNQLPGKDLSMCAKYTCEPMPLNDVVCNITGKTFSTFDGTEFKYDICNHLLARDLINDNWSIKILKNCTSGHYICSKELVIDDKSADVTVTLYTDLSLTVDGYKFTVEQLQKSTASKMKSFVINKVGSTIVFVSNLHGFWVTFDEFGDAKIGVCSTYKEKVDGLCGYFNGIMADDKRLPSGESALSTVEFGDSWSVSQDQNYYCEPRACPKNVQDQAWEMCNTITHDSFKSCSRAVNKDKFVSKCLETACECLMASSQLQSYDLSSPEPMKLCKCSILQNYVVDCLSADETVILDSWRSVHQCEADCPAPLVHRDCYRRRCEPSCENINECNYLPGTCFSGCYCPEGKVRKGNDCIPMSDCRDCVCDGFGKSQYITYDRSNFTFDGNCTYLLTRDVMLKNVHTFQVYATLGPCESEDDNYANKKYLSSGSCTQSLHILYGPHVIHLQRGNKKYITTIVDGIVVSKLPLHKQWIEISVQSGREIKISLPESQVEVHALFDDMSFSISVPSVKYESKLEGLCGDCNGNPDDDLKVNPNAKNIKTDSFQDKIQSWLSDDPALPNESECVSEDVAQMDCIPLPPEEDPCFEMLNEATFGECNLIVDPLLYMSLCQADMCKSGPNQQGACSHIAAYAKECSRNGICIDWKNGLCKKDMQCPTGMIYKPCGCAETCEIVKQRKEIKDTTLKSKSFVKKVASSPGECLIPKIEGCFCPDGKINHNGKCIPENQCNQCDDELHFPGDKWFPNKCSECECGPDGLVKCIKLECSSRGAVCELGYKQLVIDDETECCPIYKCVPEPSKPKLKSCPDKPLPQCGPDQHNKMDIDTDGCSKYICECKPIEECKPLEIVSLRPGEVESLDQSGCCPVKKVICDKSKCPPKVHSCNQEFYDPILISDPNDCCEEYICKPPKNLCLIEEKGYQKYIGIGEIYRTSNPCITKKCATNPIDGNAMLVEYVEDCFVKSCPPGFEMQVAEQKCCGTCIQTKCSFEYDIYGPGQTWHSEDNCTTYKCIEISSGQYVVNSMLETCPDISDCPEYKRYFKGCCQYCKDDSQSLSNCMATSLSDSETVQMVDKYIDGHGTCRNIVPIRGYVECNGACNSGTKYDRDTFKQRRKCECCSVANYDEINVNLKCDDGHSIDVLISVPRMCSCQPCDGGVSDKGKSLKSSNFKFA